MPLIRYRTRDLTSLLPNPARAMRRIGRISGRSDDMLIIRGVNVYPSQIEAALALEDRLAPHYLIELRRPGHMDEMDVVVETRSILGGKLSGADLAALERSAAHQIKAFVGVTATVRVVEPGTLERSRARRSGYSTCGRRDKAQCRWSPRTSPPTPPASASSGSVPPMKSPPAAARVAR